jgi:hypothetical protein
VSVRLWRRLGVATVALLAMFAWPSGEAVAGGTVGYVRLAHLSPDTPDVDVYLDRVSGGVAKVFPGVGYGTVSAYLTLATGTYAVAMRPAGAPSTEPPVLATSVTVVSGHAYTVAGVGTHADLGLRVIDDDLSLPPPGRAKLRIVQASLRAPVMSVSVAGGPVIADDIAFATTTDYLDVTPGRLTLVAQGAGGGLTATLTASVAAGDVYSLIVLDAAGGGLTTQLRIDAQRAGTIPRGGVATGAGGTAPTDRTWLWVGLVAATLTLLAAGGITVRRRLR